MYLNLTSGDFTDNRAPTYASNSSHTNTMADTKQLHLNPGLYPHLDTDLIITHFRMSATWMHSPNGRDIVPVPQGMDLNTRCIMYSVQPYFTDDPTDCRGTFGRDYTRYGRYENDMADPDFGSVYFHFHIDGTQCRNMFDAFRTLPILGAGWRAKDDCYVEEEERGTIFQNPVKSDEGARIVQPKFNIPNIFIPVSEWTLMIMHNDLVWTPVKTPDYLGTSTGSAGSDMEAVETREETTATRSAYIVPGDNNNYYYIEGRLTTLTNKHGTLVSTVTRILGGDHIPARTTRTLTGADGQATATITTDLELSAVTTTLYSSGTPYSTATVYGIPYPTPTNRNWTTPPESAIRVVPMTAASYFAGSFLPVILTTILSILVQPIHRSILAMFPFRVLSKPSSDGATAHNSLGVNPTGAPWHAMRLAWKLRDPLLVLSYLLSILSLVLTGLSGEAVGLTLRGDCIEKTFYGCFMSLAVVTRAARAVEVTLAVVCVTLSLLGLYVFSTWRVGTCTNPRNIIGIASLIAGKDVAVRDLMRNLDTPTEGRLLSSKEMIRCFGEHRRFAMRSREGRIFQVGEDTTHSKASPSRKTRLEHCLTRQRRQVYQHRTSLLVGYGLRLLLLGGVSGLLTVVAYYGSVQLSWDNSFERFMDSQTFGVTFLFTVAGATIDIFWDYFFHGKPPDGSRYLQDLHSVLLMRLSPAIEITEPYRRLSSNTSKLADLYITRSSNVFSGFVRTVPRRDLFIGIVAFTGVSAKCLPICLANIPFSLILTWNTYVACTRIALAILSLMILVLLGSFFRRQPYLPVDPNTIVGSMYYICDSHMLDDIPQLAELASLGVRFRFGRMTGSSGSERIGVDYYAVTDSGHPKRGTFS